jgi:chaperonin cofactor prefoldin
MGLFGPNKKDLESQIADLENKIKTLDDSNTTLQSKIKEMEPYIHPDQKLLEGLKQEIRNKTDEKLRLENELLKLQREIDESNIEYDAISEQVIDMNEKSLMQSFGLYKPQYDFANSSQYKDKLKEVRDQQKALIKEDKAATCASSWTVNYSAQEGKKMVKDVQKALLRAFNLECEDTIAGAKFNNIEQCEKRITVSKDSISKLGTSMNIAITDKYYRLKLQELHLAYEFASKKEEEKQKLRELKAEEREREKVEKELEEARKALEKEQKQLQKALTDLKSQFNNEPDSEKRESIAEKISTIEDNIGEVDKKFQNVDYRAANKRAGYVYIISNIGSFGDNIFKIGMTRRLEPMERIYELGDASVPFDFDVHALIFTDDAPGLESALHRAFETEKVNMINSRREFFNVPLDDIKEVVKTNFDKTVEFMDIPPAEQYRESQIIKSQNKS